MGEATFEIGRQVGQYRVVRLIGAGGMGQVYEVEHVGLGVRYALKTFSYAGGDFGELLRTKFLEEGQMLARLRHPHLIRVFDLAIDEATKTPYFVMDLVLYKDGNPYSLVDVERESIADEFAATWFRDICDALDYIHGMGVVHRDIKEANLLLTADKHVMLSDFGVSHIFSDKLVKSGNARKTTLTGPNHGRLVFGTNHYMAPEVAEGRSPTVAADVYSLGATIFHLLTGVWYEPGTNAMELLSNRSYDWAGVLAPMLAADPAQRPTQLAALAARLKPTNKLLVLCRRKLPTIPLSAVALAFSVVLILAVVWYRQNRIHRPAEGADRPVTQEISCEYDEERRARERREADSAVERARQARERELARQEAENKAAADRKKAGERKKAEQKAAEQKKRREDEAARHKTAEGKNRVAEASVTTYAWFSGGGKDSPQGVRFLLKNGAEVQMVPFNADGKVFWVSRNPVTCAAWRDFQPQEHPELATIEQALPPEFALCPVLDEKKCQELAAFLTAKYKRSLPNGFVFRLPTEVERMAIRAEDATRKRYEMTGRRMEDCVNADGAVGRAKFASLRAAAGLDKFGKWSATGELQNRHVYVSGLAMPRTSGIYDAGSDDVHAHLVIALP